MLESSLLRDVERQINLSASLTLSQKESLKQKLVGLSSEQVAQLEDIFQEEEQLKQQALTEFFTEHPEMLEAFERFVQKKVWEAYLKIEESERKGEEVKMDHVLQSF